MNRILRNIGRGLAFWYIILAAGMVGAMLLDSGGVPIQGPLLPGQERPIYYPSE